MRGVLEIEDARNPMIARETCHVKCVEFQASGKYLCVVNGDTTDCDALP